MWSDELVQLLNGVIYSCVLKLVSRISQREGNPLDKVFPQLHEPLKLNEAKLAEFFKKLATSD